jgi:ATP-dependent helicase/nuclease subunit B
MSRIQFCPVIPGQLVDSAARAIAGLESARLPNLNGIVVLLPNLHVARETGIGLRQAAGVETLILPRFETLRSLAKQAEQARPLPFSRRQSQIYQALREREWFPRSELWHVSTELLRLFDEMTLCQVSLPANAVDFSQQLESAYAAGHDNAALQFESRLVFELWHAMLADVSDEADDAARYQMQLAGLLSSFDAPLYVLGMNDLLPVELDFLERYAQHAPVCCFFDDPALAQPDSLPALLAACWPAPDGEAPMHDRVAIFKRGAAVSPINGRIEICSAHGLEHEASAAAFQIGQWLAQGKTSIAVVAQDRLVARRMRALLERDLVLVQDETGWTLSTTSASTVVMRWLDNLDSRFHHQDLLDFLKSPFVLAGWEAERRSLGVFGLEQAIRKHSVVSGLNRYRSLLTAMAKTNPNSEAVLRHGSFPHPSPPPKGEGDEGNAPRCFTSSGAPEALELLDALHRAQSLLPKSKALSLSKWIANLQASLAELHILEALRHDLAGAQLLDLLETLRADLAQDGASFEYGEWRKWMNLQFEEAVFRDEEVSSPVIFTHLGACRLRKFDAVAMVGADAAHLPAPGRKSAFFNQSVRASLGLKDRGAALEIERQDLLSLLATCDSVWISWQSHKNGEHNALSPWLERLDVFHCLAFDDKGVIKAAPVLQTPLSPAFSSHGIPVPDVPPAQVPTRLSVSAYNSLVACPYQFFARHVLRLNELDEVSVALEKRDYGEYVHAILHQFHSEYSVLSAANLDTDSLREAHINSLQTALQTISEAAFKRATEADFISQAWLLRWQARIPAYIQWQIEREAQGWRAQAGELKAVRQIALPNDHELALHGRLDRVDRGTDGSAVLDYKTQSSLSLKKKLEPAGEDVQLACYALLMDEPPIQALFVALDETPVKNVGDDLSVSELAEANLARLQEIFTAMYQGAGLPAQGVTAVCQYCEMRGLCRKDYWNA